MSVVQMAVELISKDGVNEEQAAQLSKSRCDNVAKAEEKKMKIAVGQ